MAPEVFKHRRYDKKVDVFSFAMILYEVLEGDLNYKTSFLYYKKQNQSSENLNLNFITTLYPDA